MNRRHVLLLVLLAVVCYINTLPNGFVAGDRQFIVQNPAVGDFSAVLKSFSSDYWNILGGQSFMYYRPVVVFSHFVDYSLYGLNPLGHHLSNLLFHIIVTLLVYRLACRLLPGRLNAAFVAAGLFALHPVHTHSVSYVMGRTDILAAVFYLSGFIVLTGSMKQGQKMFFSCICYMCGLLCKEIAVTLPVLYLLYVVLWEGAKKLRERQVWVLFASLCASFAAYALLRFYAVGGFSSPENILASIDVWQRAVMVVITIGFYTAKLLFPVQLCFYSNLVIPDSVSALLGSAYFWAGCLFLAVFGIALVKIPRVCFCLAWIVCSLLPVLNITPLPVFAKENYLYIPSVSFCLLLALPFATNGATRWRRLYFALVLCVCVFYAIITVQRNTDYRDPITFMKATLLAMPEVEEENRSKISHFEGVKNHFTTHRNLGRLYKEQGEWATAEYHFQQALHYIPSYFPGEYASDVYLSLGQVYEKQTMPDRARAAYEKALSGSARPYYIYNLLGVLEAKRGALYEAKKLFLKAIDENKEYAPAFFNLSLVYVKLDMPDEASRALQQAARLNPAYQNYLQNHDQR